MIKMGRSGGGSIPAGKALGPANHEAGRGPLGVSTSDGQVRSGQACTPPCGAAHLGHRHFVMTYVHTQKHMPKRRFHKSE